MSEKNTKLLGAFIGEVISFFLDGWFTKLIWNGLIVSLSHNRVDSVTYWQALLLTILAGIFFKVRTVNVREG